MQLYHTGSGRSRTHDYSCPDEKYIYGSETQALIMTTKTMDPAVQSLPLMESFYTIQGEGFHQGKAAYFIRLGGCDVGCVWCDVKESWDAEAHPRLSVTEIV